MSAPLEGFLVLDLTQGDSGPFCTQQLGDAGADVIKVEPLDGDWSRPLGPPFVDGDSTFFIGLNRNKKSLAVDLATPQGKAIALKLAEKADIFVESFRPGVIDEMGLGYEGLRRINPRLIYCSISWFGQTGPYARKPASDLVLQGMSGLHRFLGVVGKEPVKIGWNYAGVVGDIYASQAILGALFARMRSGIGQKVESSVLQAMVATQHNYVLSDSPGLDPATANTGFNVSHLGSPNSGYRTRDVPVGFGFNRSRDEHAWERFCRAVGISEEVINDPRFNTDEKRRANEKLLKPYYEEAFKDKSSREIMKLLDETDAVAAPMHNYETLFNDPYVVAQEMLMEMEHATAGKMNTLGLMWKLAKTPASVRLAPPKLGQHTREILSMLQHSKESIRDLEAKGIVKTWSIIGRREA